MPHIRSRTSSIAATLAVLLATAVPAAAAWYIKFDGVDVVNKIMIDRKYNVTRYPKSYRQAQNQSLALEQNGMTGVWEVPDAKVAAEARKILAKQLITNIRVRIVAP